MKNRILVFLVLITNYLGAQSVDPETFPTVTSGLGSKYLYTNTGGEGKVSIKTIMDSVKILDTTTITYADFYTAITGGNLVVGKTYIIMDFQTVYDQMDFDNTGTLKGTLTTKTGATEQIWVLALAPNQIASQAYSATYPNDKIQYDWTYNTTLVNGSPAKGRISERIDENNNRTDYDHREIKFIRYDDGAGNFTQINDSGRTSQEFLTFVQNFTGGTIKDNWLGDFYSIGALLGQEYANNVFNGSLILSNKSSSTSYNNTFNGDVFENTFNNVKNNIFSGNIESNRFIGEVFNNTFSNLIYNTFSGVLGNNVFIGNINKSVFSGYINLNIFNNDVSESVFSSNINDVVFNVAILNSLFSGYLNNNTFTSPTQLYYLAIRDELIGKTIDDVTYPFLFSTIYKKEILKASNGSNYIRYFNGTADVNTLIP